MLGAEAYAGRVAGLLSEPSATGVIRFECYSSLNAEGFYAALGFASISRMEIRLGPRHTLPAVLMRRPI